MKDPLIHKVYHFLKSSFVPGRPLLLGFSGGSDSQALLHLLLECKKFFPLDIHLAHIDHGWREESREQSEQLRGMAQFLGLPFYLHQLSPSLNKGNLEDRGRIERLKFFYNLYQEGDFQALLLAHQADDQAETVLKRILEGSDLLSIGGMQPHSFLQGMVIWRPLLKISKAQIVDWLKQRRLKWIDDSSNQDLRFLRARMRLEMFPVLKRSFGKEIEKSLERMSSSAKELKNYIDRKIFPYQKQIQYGPLGAYLDFNLLPLLEKVEVKALLKMIFQEEGEHASFSVLEMMTGHVLTKAANKTFIFKTKTFALDRGVLFWFKKPLPCFAPLFPSEEKGIEKEGWEWEVSHKKGKDALETSKNLGWKDLWQGKVSVMLPEELTHLELRPVSYQIPFAHGSSLKKWWEKHRVPAFLRSILPVLIQDGQIIHEFLTGKNQFHKLNNFNLSMILSISLKNKDK